MTNSVCRLMTLVSILAVPAFAAKGAVVYRVGGCDYFVVSTAAGYDVLEWYGGFDPEKGDVLVGSFEEYGFHDIYDMTSEEELRVWVEEYGLSKADALEKMADQCE